AAGRRADRGGCLSARHRAGRARGRAGPSAGAGRGHPGAAGRRRAMRWLGAVLLLALFAAAPVQARVAEDDAPRILMMLRLAPAHFRAGSGYGGGYGEDQSAAARRRIAAAVARRNGLRLAGNWPMPIIEIDCFILTVPRGRAPAEAAAQVARDPAVEWS